MVYNSKITESFAQLKLSPIQQHYIQLPTIIETVAPTPFYFQQAMLHLLFLAGFTQVNKQ
jgi:hypothetical protein